MPRRIPDWLQRSKDYVTRNVIGFETKDGYYHLGIPIRRSEIRASNPEQMAHLYSYMFSHQLLLPI